MQKYESNPVDSSVVQTAHAFDTEASLPSGSKLISVRNNGSEVAYIDSVGKLSVSSIVNAASAYSIFKAGKFTTAGGDATEVISVPGALSTDIAFVNVQTLGTGSRSIIAAIPGTDNITVTLSGDPSTNHILSWQVLKAN